MNNHLHFVMRLVSAAMITVICTSVKAQQAYPNKPIRLVVPYAAGGATTIVARLLAQRFSESMGQPMLVDNRPGGGTLVGVGHVAKSAPDGYTILLTGSTIVLLPLLTKTPYDPIKDFAPIGTIGSFGFVLLVNPSLPVNTVNALVDYAKGRQGQLNFATPGAGGTQHLAHELLNMAAGIQTMHVPYKSGDQALTDLLGGRVQFYFSNPAPAIPHINSGKLRALAISGSKRLSSLPDLPTFEEAGWPALTKAGGNYGLLAPAGTSKSIVDRISAEVATYIATPGFQEILASNGLTPLISSPEQYASLLKAEYSTNATVVKRANMKLDD